MALTPELTTYFDNLDELFGTMGWRQLVDDASKEIYGLQVKALEASSFEEIMFLRGQADVLNRIVTLRDVSETTRADHELEDDEINASI